MRLSSVLLKKLIGGSKMKTELLKTFIESLSKPCFTYKKDFPEVHEHKHVHIHIGGKELPPEDPRYDEVLRIINQD